MTLHITGDPSSVIYTRPMELPARLAVRVGGKWQEVERVDIDQATRAVTVPGVEGFGALRVVIDRGWTRFAGTIEVVDGRIGQGTLEWTEHRPQEPVTMDALHVKANLLNWMRRTIDGEAERERGKDVEGDS